MVAVLYTNGSDTYEVSNIVCVKCIAKQIESIKHLLGDTDPNEYKLRMLGSVHENLAIHVVKNGKETAWFYGTVQNGKYLGNSIWAEDKYSAFLILKAIFEINPSHKIQFNPHSTEGLKMFKSMIKGDSIRMWYLKRDRVTILRDTVEKRGIALFDYLGFKV